MLCLNLFASRCLFNYIYYIIACQTGITEARLKLQLVVGGVGRWVCWVGGGGLTYNLGMPPTHHHLLGLLALGKQGPVILAEGLL